MRACANHAPHVIPATATHVENGAARQIGEVRQHAVPFPVGTPFGVDVQAIEREGPFAPGHQIAHQLFKADHLPFTQGRFAFGGNAVQQIQLVRGHLRQKLYRIAPLLKLAVQLLALPGGNLGRQGLKPVGEMIFGDQLIEVTEIDHAVLPPFSATSEPKLKHWNHSSLCSKPALCRRALWASTESVSITFSSMLRFWLISSSL